MNDIKHTLERFASAITNYGDAMGGHSLAKPVSESAVAKAEKQLGLTFPPRFRRFLTTSCGGMRFDWSLDDDQEITLPGERETIVGGELSWSFKDFVADNKRMRQTLAEGDEYMLEFMGRDKVPFASTPNGDMFAVGLSGDAEDKILYLSHDIDDIHNYVVAADIDDFFARYAPLGFAGPEYWIWEQFTNKRTTMIDPTSKNARTFLARIERVT